MLQIFVDLVHVAGVSSEEVLLVELDSVQGLLFVPFNLLLEFINQGFIVFGFLLGLLLGHGKADADASGASALRRAFGVIA